MIGHLVIRWQPIIRGCHPKHTLNRLETITHLRLTNTTTSKKEGATSIRMLMATLPAPMTGFGIQTVTMDATTMTFGVMTAIRRANMRDLATRTAAEVDVIVIPVITATIHSVPTTDTDGEEVILIITTTAPATTMEINVDIMTIMSVQRRSIPVTVTRLTHYSALGFLQRRNNRCLLYFCIVQRAAPCYARTNQHLKFTIV